MTSGNKTGFLALFALLGAAPAGAADARADSALPAAILLPPSTLPPALILPASDLPPAPIVAQVGRAEIAEAPEAPSPSATAVSAAARQPTSQPPKAPAAYFVQVAAVSSRARADSLAAALGGFVMPAGKLFRIRTGPYPRQAEARAALDQIHAKGYAEARLMANDARTAAALAALEPTP
ncbi:MAG: SPOR domain-containing protein [Sphingomonadales bacterium]|nr:SPOR domain-containing protein [Sphingomonadales bacterium]